MATTPPAWQEIQGLDSRINALARSPFDATIGAGVGEYETLKDAYDAGKRSILAVADTDETAADTPGDMALTGTEEMMVTLLPGVTVDMATYKFDMQTSTCKLYLLGHGTIQWAHTVAGALVEGTTSSVLVVADLTLDNNSTASGCHFNDSGTDLRGYNIEYQVPGETDCQLRLQRQQSSVSLLRVVVANGNSNALYVNQGQADQVVFTGSTSAVSTQVVAVVGAIGVLSNVSTSLSSGNDPQFDVSGLMTSVWRGSTFNVRITADNAQVHFVEQSNGTIDVQGFDNVRISNVEMDAVDLSDAAAVGCTVSDSVFDVGLLNIQGDGHKIRGCNFTVASGDHTVAGEHNSVIDCDFDTSDNLDVTGDFNKIMGNRVGPIGGVGSSTIDLPVGGDNNVAIGNQTDAAVINNGANNEVANNVVF